MRSNHGLFADIILRAALTIPMLFLLCSCGSDSEPPPPAVLPTLTPAVGATLATCTDLATQFTYDNTTISSSELVAAGLLIMNYPPGNTTSYEVGEHCLVTGVMNERASTLPVPAITGFGIGFEMRLPTDWNGRFYYQANGGIDGAVVTAMGENLGGGAITTALDKGFAVISSNAGHQDPVPWWGLDPQARLDYGYNAVGTLTPMAKVLISAAYGKTPDRSYFAGCSNGGRHAMVAAARFADQYDGILAGNPGFNLPKAAVAQLYGVQQYSDLVTGVDANGDPDIATALTADEISLISEKILQQCDGLDGASDGIVADTAGCQSAFDLDRDVPTCTGARDGSCLSAGQMTALGNIMAGARNSAGEPIYASFPYDPGMAGADWANWESFMATERDPGAAAFIFTTPPSTFGGFVSQTGYQYAMNFSMDTDAPKIFETDATYTEAPMTFMTPPNPTDLSTLRDRGAKMMVFHGVADGVFSPNDTAAWYQGLDSANGGSADEFARLFLVPGMNHCKGGVSTDQFDMVDALIDWVEQGQAPDSVLATARGAGNAGGENTELPADWAPDRTRPLCPYPRIAMYNGSGNINDAANFTCSNP